MGVNMSKFVLLTSKPWHNDLFLNLASREEEHWIRVSERKEFSRIELEVIKPNRVFIPHWSYIIPKEIWSNFECIVFHMTDLPYGRGGSPLQNLIVRGHKETQISALRVNEGIDTGDIYLKRPLSLEGTAQEIFLRAVPIIREMVEKIIDENIIPKPQTGEPVVFKRRKPNEGNIGELEDIKKVYDFIRMLDVEGYPPAFLETKHLRFEFTGAAINDNKEISANVKIVRK
jgi:methionyl-tRNA formyltransferase